jgi:phage FluMu protein Com
MPTFEDQTIDILCPKCSHVNSVAVRDFEEHTESHIVCFSCKAGIKIEAHEFHDRLDDVRKELEELEQEATRESRPPKRPRKGDFQI